MNITLKRVLLSSYNVTINRRIAESIIRYCILFETRDKHPLALNTPLLAVHPVYFLPKDQAFLFELFDIDRRAFAKDVWSVPEVHKERKVSSDPFNILCVWLTYRVMTSELPKQLKEQTMTAIMKLFHYRFFTSVVNNSFKHGAKEDVMALTIDELSGKFDIKRPETTTWKLVIEKRVADILDHNSIHFRYLEIFSPDQKILYIITDAQTRIRTKINLIAFNYYKNIEKGRKLSTYKLDDEIDGQKSIKAIISSFDNMVVNISNDALNVNKFIDYDFIETICAMNSNIKPGMLRSLLMKFSDMAVLQKRQGKSDESIKTGDRICFIGYQILIANIIQKTYRLCMLNRSVNMRSKLEILERTQNLYKSSRLSDPGVLDVKYSVSQFVDANTTSARESTNASLKIAFVVYVMLKSFEYL